MRSPAVPARTVRVSLGLRLQDRDEQEPCIVRGTFGSRNPAGDPGARFFLSLSGRTGGLGGLAGSAGPRMEHSGDSDVPAQGSGRRSAPWGLGVRGLPAHGRESTDCQQSRASGLP